MSSRSFIGFSSLTYWDDFGPKMRTATILFDEVVLHVPTPDTPASIVDQLDEREGISNDTRLALGTIWQPIHRVLPNYTFLSLGLKPETPERVAEVAWQVTVEETKKQLAADTPGFMHEASWANLGLADSIAAWSAIDQSAPCTYLTNGREAAVIAQLTAPAESQSRVAVLHDALPIAFPYLAHLTWDEVLEMREHPFVEGFRARVKQIQNTARTSDIKGLVQLLEEVERNDLRELAARVRPSIGKAALKAVAGNVPVPIPLNPVGIALAAAEVNAELERARRFGWLYFVLDMQGGA